MSISPDVVKHVARLAHVGLMAEEVDDLSAELSTVLDHIASLQEVDTENVPPTVYAVAIDNVMREDEVHPSWDVDTLLANAPERHDGFFAVQAIFD